MENSQGDEEAFLQLARRYGPMLTRYVRCRIANPSDAEDVLQETLVAVWLGFGAIRDPSRVQAWLLHVAQNRCRDYFRARERREMPLEEDALQEHASRFGLHQYRQTKTFADVMDALEAAPRSAREAAQRFYLEGLSVAEIADDAQSPQGTVKRQLFEARRAARTFLGLPGPAPQTRRENINMTAQNTSESPPGFPLTRPEIRIIELQEPPFAVDCQELRSWSIIPRVGEQASTADYSLPEWKLGEVSVMQALRAAKIHKVEGVEIEVRRWQPESGWQRSGAMYARLTDDKAEYLAVHLPNEESTQVETFLDSGFAWNWGAMDRAISDQGLLRRTPDGSLLLSDEAPRHNGMGIGFGVVRLEIGGKSFTCLRVLNVPEDGDLAKSEDECVSESYLTREGRTLLVRHRCRPHFAEAAEFPVILDESDRLVINDVAFVHWYDTITNIAL